MSPAIQGLWSIISIAIVLSSAVLYYIGRTGDVTKIDDIITQYAIVFVFILLIVSLLTIVDIIIN